MRHILITQGLSRQAAVEEILKKAGLDPHLTLIKDENGRPCFAERPTLYFSISHKGATTAYAVSDAPIGIDLECPDAILRPEALAHRFFAPGELAAFEAAVAKNTSPALAAAVIWTKKEALAKYLGLGLGKTMNIDTTDQQNTLVFETSFPTEAILTLCYKK